MHPLLSIFIIFCLTTIAIASLSLAPWVPTRKRDLKRICALADLKPDKVFYDLGCGDGRLVVYANKHYGVKAVGIELALPLFVVCKIRQLLNRQKKIKFKFKNLFRENLSNADIIYVFAYKERLTGKLKQKLEKELKPGTQVISYTFPIEGWRPEIISKPNEKDLSIYLYKTKK